MEKRIDPVTVKFTTEERRRLEKMAIYEKSDLSKVVRAALLDRLAAHQANLAALQEMLEDSIPSDKG